MDDIQSKLNSIMGNPQMMQQIMSMAQALGNSEQTGTEPPPQQPQQSQQTQQSPQHPQKPKQQPSSGMDIAALQRVASLAQRNNIDQNQRALLRALQPYLSKDRIEKLERAMRAAKLASAAGFMFGGAPGGGGKNV